MNYSQRWDLDVLYEGESNSKVLKAELEIISKEINELEILFQGKSDMESLLEQLQRCDLSLQEVSAFVECLLAQDVDDEKAPVLQSEVLGLQAQLKKLKDQLGYELLKMNDVEFKSLLKKPILKEISFYLSEKRQRAKEMLPLQEENLITDLAINGYHSWTTLYNSLVGKIKIPFRGRELSVGQADNQLSSVDRSVRQDVFAAWEHAWKNQEDIFALILNNLSGFRLKTYEKRKWLSALKEPLEDNRMKYETLQAMWKEIDHSKECFRLYFQKRAALLGIKKLSWYDVDAPLPFDFSLSLSYDSAAKLLQEQFAKFSPAFSALAKQAFEERWIEAEDRSGKRPGGFCLSFPKSKTSRIFMTYSGTLDNVMTLAHELGHAYHNRCVQHLPLFAQDYRMNVAETASTFAEMLLLDSLLKMGLEKNDQLLLLDLKIQRAAAFLMDIQARFNFEKEFYERRKKGPLTAQELNDLMTQAQQTSFLGLLEGWHPRFWASKLHFYFTDVPFYNFPYTFGYLFSLGIYAKALKEGPSFSSKYDNLLQETGQMTVEDLAKKHLEVDLSKDSFWKETMQLIEKDISSFLNLSIHTDVNFTTVST